MATNSDALVRFYASGMVFNCHSNASYLTATQGRSRAGRNFFLGSVPKDGCPIFLNSAILTNCTILKLVAASAAEAELGALFLNTLEVTILRLTLQELGHPQSPTPIHANNTTTVGIVNSTIKRQRSRAMNMRYFWLLCQEAQRILNVRYHPGAENLGDYQTKLHKGAHHERACPFYVQTNKSPQFLQWAARPSVRKRCVGQTGDLYTRRITLPDILSV